MYRSAGACHDLWHIASIVPKRLREDVNVRSTLSVTWIRVGHEGTHFQTIIMDNSD